MKLEGLIQFIKFGLVGISNTVVDWLTFFLLTHFVMTAKDAEPTAKAIAFLIAVLNSYIWNTIWTFHKEYKKTTQGKNNGGKIIFIKFFIVSLIGWGINYISFKYTRFNLNQGQIVSLIAASGSATLWNFFANKFWTYKK